jgi:hypothetical protein
MNFVANTGEISESITLNTRKSTRSAERRMTSARESSKGAFANLGEKMADENGDGEGDGKVLVFDIAGRVGRCERWR